MNKEDINEPIYEIKPPIYRAGFYAFGAFVLYWVILKNEDYRISVALIAVFLFYMLFFFLRSAQFYKDYVIISFPFRKLLSWNTSINIKYSDIDWIALSNQQGRNTSINFLKFKIVLKKDVKNKAIESFLYYTLYLEFAIGVKAFLTQLEQTGVVIEYNLKGPGAEEIEP